MPDTPASLAHFDLSHWHAPQPQANPATDTGPSQRFVYKDHASEPFAVQLQLPDISYHFIKQGPTDLAINPTGLNLHYRFR